MQYRHVRIQPHAFRYQERPSDFQRYVDATLKPVSSFAFAYLNDILIHSADASDHDVHVQ
ncbi:hypothetical protein K470DRAFT_260361 [Piedraia hortae CBS 480.64]|uniref:Reverse transcriptase domain-containing protein n=1 Tax=Piedraia hortae CBS 480.64 TaxID=1314780 RepID=A0A6A7BRN2_9PEZI|nr:hypothetical protein K470DRAFT_260361 [Piedraia hortae CBS 480.64]